MGSIRHLPHRRATNAARRVVALAAVALFAIILAGCGGDGDRVLPEVTVTDVATGDDVTLTDLVPSPTPVLVWFWAPH